MKIWFDVVADEDAEEEEDDQDNDDGGGDVGDDGNNFVVINVVGVLEVSDLEPALQSESFCKLDQTRPRGQLRSFFRFC